ncbi:Zn-dependent protease with chaperone function [Streptomonospora nanhaiensis]|uniref:Zn-dependent protease with chaperone function n=1 Tax=Streptomonospora nanhaiensis TaxID=1323731 RepID=A0A853BPB2_9ACTN|nr:M48 family metallopeptidase [Streptomonospora nanhaiensis]NYI96624.1 Zn-dependent protease with chaperone function [Streptomonospora nanhaiensis]
MTFATTSGGDHDRPGAPRAVRRAWSAGAPAGRARAPLPRSEHTAARCRPPLAPRPGAVYPVSDRHAPAEPLLVPRHPWELPLVVAAALATLCLLGMAVHTLWTATEVAHRWFGLAVLAVPAGSWTARGLRHAEQRAESIRISPTQFPEAYHAVQRLSARMGLGFVPDAYVALGSGAPHATPGGHGTRRYLVISSDLFEVGGRLRDPDGFRFLVAHQLGHIAAGHTSFPLRAATSLGRLLPVLGPALARAMEYTADNHAHAHCPEGAHAIRLLAGGKYLYPEVNLSEMAERGRTDRGPFLFLYTLLSSRPANTRRMAALRDRDRPGRVFL